MTNPIQIGLRESIRTYCQEGVDFIDACNRLVIWQQARLAEIRSYRFNPTPFWIRSIDERMWLHFHF